MEKLNYYLVNYFDKYKLPYMHLPATLEDIKDLHSKSEKILQELIDKSGLDRWASNWPFLNMKYSNTHIDFFKKIRISVWNVQVVFSARQLYPFLDNPNDISEWRELLTSCWTFTKLLLEELFSNYRISPDLPKRIADDLEQIEPIISIMKNFGDDYHIIFEESSTFIKTKNGLTIKLIESLSNSCNDKIDNVSGKTFDLIDILADEIELDVNNSDEINELVTNYKSRQLSHLFKENTYTGLFTFDSESHQYNVNLEWNLFAKNILKTTHTNGYNLFKTCDGYIGQHNSLNFAIYRPTLSELLNKINTVM